MRERSGVSRRQVLISGGGLAATAPLLPAVWRAPSPVRGPAAGAMGALWWRWSQYTLSPANEDIGEVMNAIAQGLPNLGYSGVQVAADVHGSKGDFLLAVLYLYIGERKFWQIVACGGDGSQAEAEGRSMKSHR